MFDHFNFSEANKAVAKTYFDAADSVFEAAKANKELSIAEKINDEGEIDIKWISDATVIENSIDKNGNPIEKQRPIIDLVQQGGGMWGIALLGYCYIMEKVGIRFYSHGGTSAGAINALFLSSISSDVYEQPPLIETTDNRGGLKSEILTLIVSNMDFSKFMNRKGLIGRIQKMLFKNFQSKRLPLILGLSSLAIIILMYWLFGLFLKYAGMSISDVRYFSFIIGTFTIIAFFFLIYILFSKVLGENFGINTGNPFLFWVKENLERLKISSTKDLYNSLSETQLIRNLETDDLTDNLQLLVRANNAKTNYGDQKDQAIIMSKRMSLRMGEKYIGEGESPKIVLITSNLSHNRIVRFPEDASEYWNDYFKVNPAAYVRASMSLPFIFKTFIPNNTSHVHYANANAPKIEVKLKARMVDGGMLSNFPIREFHRSSNKTPSFPTFGVLLSKRSEITSENRLKGQKNTLISYILSYIQTFRNFYDNDFIINNNEIKSRVVTVDTRRDKTKEDGERINWLDFWMGNDDKRLLFVRGAEAAIRQLDKFDWKQYKDLRIKLANQ